MDTREGAVNLGMLRDEVVEKPVLGTLVACAFPAAVLSQPVRRAACWGRVTFSGWRWANSLRSACSEAWALIARDRPGGGIPGRVEELPRDLLPSAARRR